MKTNINLRIDRELKAEFYKACDDNHQAPSVILRCLIELFIEKDVEIL